MILVLLQKLLGNSQLHRSTDPPEVLVCKIQQGDAKLRNQLITDYQPFIAKVTSRFCKRYVEPGRDDEYAVALAAFDEAITQFSAVSGKSFLGFAETVIRRRLIDYVRKQERFYRQIPVSSFDIEDEEHQITNSIEVVESLKEYERQRAIEERKAEIVELNAMLRPFGITFSQLADASPKHRDSRQLLMDIARTLAHDARLMQLLLNKKTLPIKELLDKVEVSRKTLERNRKFIIAVALIYHGPYLYLKEYLRTDEPPCSGGDHHA